MDLKSLMQKLEVIDKKQNLMETKDKGDMDHDGKNEPDSKEYKDNKDAAIKKAMGKKEKADEGINYTSSIAQELLREFSLEEKVTLPADGSTPATVTKNGVTMNAPAVKNPYQGADAAKFAAMSPEDQAWLTKGGGVPDINDQYILARAPNKGKPVAAPAAAPAATPAATPAAVKVDPADLDRADQEMGAAMTANAQAATQAANGVNAAGQNVTMPDGTNPETGQKTPASTPAPAAAAKPVATTFKMDPATTAYASRLGLLKNNQADKAAIIKFQQDNGLKADGIIGPQTAKALAKVGQQQGGRGSTSSTPTAPQAGGVQQFAQKPAAPAAPGAGQKGPTKAAAAGIDPTNPLNQKPSANPELDRVKQLAGTPSAAGQPTTTSTNSQVSGTMQMGKPSGPINFNGKMVKPGDPDYAAASQALVNAQGKAANFRSQSQQNLEKKLATSGAPVSQGASQARDRDY